MLLLEPRNKLVWHVGSWRKGPWSHRKEPRLLLGRPQEAEGEGKNTLASPFLQPSYVLPGQGSPWTVIPCGIGQVRTGRGSKLAFDQCKGQTFSSPAPWWHRVTEVFPNLIKTWIQPQQRVTGFGWSRTPQEWLPACRSAGWRSPLPYKCHLCPHCGCSRGPRPQCTVASLIVHLNLWFLGTWRKSGVCTREGRLKPFWGSTLKHFRWEELILNTRPDGALHGSSILACYVSREHKLNYTSVGLVAKF